MKKSLVLSYPLSTQRSDQTGRMPRLIRVFAGRMSFCSFCHDAAQVVRLGFKLATPGLKPDMQPMTEFYQMYHGVVVCKV